MNHLGLCAQWRTKMLLVISDASVLIDIEHGELTSAMFSLPWQFAVPDILFFEELSDRHEHLLKFGLICKVMDSKLISQAYDLRQKHLQTSVNDLLALTLARDEQCLLLTGDKALRQVASGLNVEVHGTLWLVEQMLNYKKISVSAAKASFQSMRASGSRLPWGEVDKLINKK